MFVLIVGGGRIGGELASALIAGGSEVSVVEKDQARAQALDERLPTALVVHGDGDEPVILEEAHVSRAQAVAAMADEDEDNLVACLLARREYGVAATYARVNNPRNEWLFGERFGVDVGVPEDELRPADVARTILGQR